LAGSIAPPDDGSGACAVDVAAIVEDEVVGTTGVALVCVVGDVSGPRGRWIDGIARACSPRRGL
jgi:hypothetical protein